MPRPCPQSEEQSLQGNLFGAPEPTKGPAPASANASQALTSDALAEVSDADLSADAVSRPRQRLESSSDPDTSSLQLDDLNSSENDNSDAPAWAHHSQVDQTLLTPMLRHYVELKAEHPERVLLYRLGDFFECFFEDAVELSRVLELTLTGKEGGKAIGRVPMAGIPHHAAERYCAELIRRGYSVALCDQLETTPAKGALLKRGITRVLTPGTVL